VLRSTIAPCLQAIRSRVLSYPDDLSHEAKNFLTLALTRDPAQRPTAKQLLHHPWVVKCSTLAPPRQLPPPRQPAADARDAAAQAQA
jgi:serine/threonine protein kinase